MKEKLKVYHGLPKTPTRETTVLYTSLDGNVIPEICSSFDVTKEFISVPSITGYAMRCKSYSNAQAKVIYTQKDLNSNSYTIDYWMDMTNFNSSDLQASGSNFEQYGVYFGSSSKSRDELRILGIIYKPTQNKYYNWIRIYEGTTYEVQIPIELRLNHFRITRNNDTVKIYHNGKEYYSGTHSLSPIQGQYKIKFHDITVPICDLVVHDRDLGDCFPTLPQDFIDGKAIVVPALNQRQSYGDPVLHQVTELLVPAQSETELGKYYSTSVRDADGYEQCLESPELYAGNWHNWAQTYGKIRIKGLDNMTITGVLDTDTALAKIVKPSTGSTNILYLNTVDKLVVGDKIRVCDISTGVYYEHKELTVQSINTNEKSITISPSTDWILYPDKHFIFEITASSSSPVVKTVDGQVVNGTWEGLGTDTATFTMGANSGIAGKDLVVTYCLNAKGNASPYPKMPSEVIRGYDELGTELKPQNSVVIYDDYLNKKSGDKTNCPHKLYWQNSSSLTDFFGDEYNQEGYDCVKNNNKTLTYSPFPREYPMIIAEVDLFHLVESQLGETIPGNKANWIRDNVLTVKCYAHCKGLYGSTPYVEIRYQDKGSNGWSLNSGNTCKHESSSLKTIYANIGSEQIPDDGIKRFCITTKNTFEDLVINEVEVQYIYFSVEFKPNTSNDSCLYVLFREETPFKLDNKRETKPCNPIIVNTQTKEVKRLVPSTKPFSTEVLMYNSGDITSAPNSNVIVSSNQHVLTTMGTGKLETNLRNQYRGLIGKLDLTDINSSDYLGEHSYKLPVNTGNNTNGVKFVLSQPFSENFNFFQIEEYFPDVRHLALKHAIVESNKELYLRLVCLDLESDISNKSVHQYYRLPNRPLIK